MFLYTLSLRQLLTFLFYFLKAFYRGTDRVLPVYYLFTVPQTLYDQDSMSFG